MGRHMGPLSTVRTSPRPFPFRVRPRVSVQCVSERERERARLDTEEPSRRGDASVIHATSKLSAFRCERERFSFFFFSGNQRRGVRILRFDFVAVEQDNDPSTLRSPNLIRVVCGGFRIADFFL